MPYFTPFFFSICALLPTCDDSNRVVRETTVGNIAGKYELRSEFLNCELKLNKAGTFQFVGCFSEERKSQGTAKIVNDHLLLKPGQPLHDEAKEWLPLDLRIIRWGDRIYLIADDDAKHFCNVVNLGIGEPRDKRSGCFWLREGDWERKVLEQPSVPKEWLPGLLPQAIQGKVTQVLENGNATLNLGTKDGVWIDMWLCAGSNETVYVIKADRETCTIGRAFPLEDQFVFKLGMPISSRFPKPVPGVKR